jgi:hypothetical protein
VLLFAFGTGVATVAIGSPDGAWAAIGHGICGLAVVLLIPRKSRVVCGGLRRARLSRWLSLLLAALALFTLIAGLGYATGLVRSIAGMPGCGCISRSPWRWCLRWCGTSGLAAPDHTGLISRVGRCSAGCWEVS